MQKGPGDSHSQLMTLQVSNGLFSTVPHSVVRTVLLHCALPTLLRRALASYHASLTLGLNWLPAAAWTTGAIDMTTYVSEG